MRGRERPSGETEAWAANFPKCVLLKPHCQHPMEALDGEVAPGWKRGAGYTLHSCRGDGDTQTQEIGDREGIRSSAAGPEKGLIGFFVLKANSKHMRPTRLADLLEPLLVTGVHLDTIRGRRSFYLATRNG